MPKSYKVEPENNIVKNFLNKVTAGDIVEGGKLFYELINAKKEVEITKEQEATKRKRIEEDLEKFLIKNESKREYAKEYFEREYGIRRETIQGFFERLDRALDENKTDVAVQALSSIEGVVKEDPLKNFHNIGRAFEDDDEELVI